MSLNPAPDEGSEPLHALGRIGRIGLALARCSWAGTVLGADRLMDLTRQTRQGAGLGFHHSASHTLNRLTWTARRRMDPLPQAMLLLGDDIQSQWLNRVPRDLSVEAWRQFTSKLAAETRASVGWAGLGRRSRAARLELAHKLEVFLLVRQASASLGTPADSRCQFEAAAQQALDLDPRHALWMMEGLAHGHAEAALAHDPAREGLMRGLELPERALLMAHLGLGMAISERVLIDLFPEDDSGADRAIEAFIGLCRSHSNPPQEEAALESFGLVARCFFPELVIGLDSALERRQETAGQDRSASRRLREYFWHGVGRAIYFLPLHLVPGYGTVDVALRRLAEETPHSRALHNGRAGVAYAFMMVNLGSPSIMESLVEHHPEQVDPPFLEGIISAAVLRRRTTPDDAELELFLAHEPKSENPELRQSWSRLLIEPLTRALALGPDGEGVVARKLSGLGDPGNSTASSADELDPPGGSAS